MAQDKTEVKTYGLMRGKLTAAYFTAILAWVAGLLDRMKRENTPLWNVEVTDLKRKYWDGTLTESGLTPVQVGRYLTSASWAKWAQKNPTAFTVRFLPYDATSKPIALPCPAECKCDKCFDTTLPIGPIQRTQDAGVRRYFDRPVTPSTPTVEVKNEDGTVIDTVPIVNTIVSLNRQDIRRNADRERKARVRELERTARVAAASAKLERMVSESIAAEKERTAIADSGVSGPQFAHGKASSRFSTDMHLLPIAQDDMHGLAALAAMPTVDQREMKVCPECNHLTSGDVCTQDSCKDKNVKTKRRASMPSMRQYRDMAEAMSGQLRELARRSRAIDKPVSRAYVTVVSALPKLPHRFYPEGSYALLNGSYYKVVDRAWQVSTEPIKKDMQLERAANWRALITSAKLRRSLKSNPVYNVKIGTPLDGNYTLGGTGLAPIQGLANARTDSPAISRQTYGAIATYRRGVKGTFVGIRSETVCRAKDASKADLYIDGRVASHEVYQDVGADIVLRSYGRANQVRKNRSSAPRATAWRELSATPALHTADITGYGPVWKGNSVRRFVTPFVTYESIAASLNS